jgi:hypothetical protein
MRGSNEIQGVLDQAVQALQQNPPQPQGGEAQKPNEGPFKVKQEEIKQQGESQRVMVKAKIDAGLQKQKADLELRNQSTIEQIKAGNERAQTIQQAMHEVASMQHQNVHEAVQAEKDREAQADLAAKQAKAAKQGK